MVFDFGRGAATEDEPTGGALNGFIRIDVGREVSVVAVGGGEGTSIIHIAGNIVLSSRLSQQYPTCEQREAFACQVDAIINSNR